MNERIFIDHLDEVIQFTKIMRRAGYLGGDGEWQKKISDYAKHSENLKEVREWLMDVFKDFEQNSDDYKETSRRYIEQEINMHRKIKVIKKIQDKDKNLEDLLEIKQKIENIFEEFEKNYIEKEIEIIYPTY
ncbi:hypothetical protein [Ornithobacterium rhinotracheale]|uniref:hypothetical protein n=1 Tax=Ornithobacterium rhinotracheale TaxID=28251 RepID=UPI004036DC36